MLSLHSYVYQLASFSHLYVLLEVEIQVLTDILDIETGELCRCSARW